MDQPDGPPEGVQCEVTGDWVEDCQHCEDHRALAEDYAEQLAEDHRRGI
jgi:hypothetical protein